MILPVLRSLSDCADFKLTVEPFIPQLYALPARASAIRSVQGLSQLYAQTNPLVSAFAVSVVLGAVFLVASEINRNYSQVDRFWSILPNIYVVHLAAWARLAGIPHGRVDLIAVFTTLWSCRLTFNYWRRGGYEVGSEDYRWEIVKSRTHPLAFFLLNVTFISFIQSVLLFTISCLPAYVILLSSRFQPEVSAADVGYFTVEVLLVLSEWISDGQQWHYQNAKRKYQQDAKLPKGWHQADLDRGFITSGLWAYSRHPNFLAEQAIWFILYNWACHATNTMYNWSGVGCASLILLFQGSTLLTESITAGKYTEYAEYQRQVGMFMPMSLRGYRSNTHRPKVINASDAAKRQQEARKQK
ncbi:DUF1295 domain-containing protein [Ophiocordyceps camponoti-floridani]|uniref:DUF1295 domain-containing protein n=1 Tax=Ophiocordyceps camponoti-floridani TaxID=2030778 RepID=A0A8H4Q6S2_9HYPO|nr:DUF1295 domain-containing protein [Ophiocordyceps camponoti-floridani]